MSVEDNSIFEEINEELKNEQLFKLIKKHQNAIIAVIAVIAVGIMVHSSWYSRKQKNMQEITSVMLRMLQNPNAKDDILAAGLLQNAPSELMPILSIIHSGKKIQKSTDIAPHAQKLLELSTMNGVDIVWKDLAVLIYASYGLERPEKSIARLQPLTADNRPFRFSALELIGILYKNNGKNSDAISAFKKIVNSKEAPNSLKERVALLLTRINAE